MPIRLKKGSVLGLRGVPGDPMRVPQNLMTSVVFIGDKDGERFIPKGTAFYLLHKGFNYLATAKHVATAQETFWIQFSGKDGTAKSYHVDPECEEFFRWFHHPDSSVDVSVMPMHINFDKVGLQCVSILSEQSVPREFPRSLVGCGDVCYAIGLYSRHSGQKSLMPACHTGNVAMMADTNEPIPVLNKSTGQIINVVGYLAELSNLPGLSGGPVFVRQALELKVPFENEEFGFVIAPTPELKLLGVWQGSWSDPDHWDEDVRKPGGQYVQLRMGIVVPAEYLIDLLDSDEVRAHRELWVKRANAAHADVAAVASS